MSTHAPVLLNEEIALLIPMLPTVMAVLLLPPTFAGEVLQASAPELPAASTAWKRPWARALLKPVSMALGAAGCGTCQRVFFL